MSSVISVTSRVADYLERQPVGYKFKTRDLLNALNADKTFSGAASLGAVSGVMHRANELGLVARELEPTNGRQARPSYIYTLTTKFDMDTRLWRGPGGAKGRIWSNKVRQRVRTCIKSTLIEEVQQELPMEGKSSEQLADMLKEFTTDELWQELERRTQP